MRRVIASSLVAMGLGACDPDLSPCEVGSVRVAEVVDGDTLELQDGDRLRIVGVDAPEDGLDPECFGPEATLILRDLVEGRRLDLQPAGRCRDDYGRRLAWVHIGSRSLAEVLVERGQSCAWREPLGGEGMSESSPVRLRELEALARREQRGLWGACPRPPCP